MALIGMAAAKDHLRIAQSDVTHDADIQRKVDQASAVIVDYLKGRAHNPSAIATSSVASPSVITTSAAHAFVNGDTVVIAGHVDSEPNLNGSWVISNVLGDSFTIPTAVTVAGSGGTAAVWWTDATAPAPVHVATCLMLTHLFEHRGDDPESDESLWRAIERVLVRLRDPALA